MAETYRGEIDLPASSNTIFAYLTEPALLTEWWPDGADTDPVAGGSYHFWWDGPGWHLRGEYLAVEEPNRIEFTWEWDHEEWPPRRVDIRLSIADAGTTHLIVEHDAGFPDERISYQQGWEFFLPQLREALASAH
jgi:uncharacterized protein YndB with AHSA1/START domain